MQLHKGIELNVFECFGILWITEGFEKEMDTESLRKLRKS
jgi:hypothetical protein